MGWKGGEEMNWWDGKVGSGWVRWGRGKIFTLQEDDTCSHPAYEAELNAIGGGFEDFVVVICDFRVFDFAGADAVWWAGFDILFLFGHGCCISSF
jgi:hypothetical protein